MKTVICAILALSFGVSNNHPLFGSEVSERMGKDSNFSQTQLNVVAAIELMPAPEHPLMGDGVLKRLLSEYLYNLMSKSLRGNHELESSMGLLMEEENLLKTFGCDEPKKVWEVILASEELQDEIMEWARPFVKAIFGSLPLEERLKYAQAIQNARAYVETLNMDTELEFLRRCILRGEVEKFSSNSPDNLLSEVRFREIRACLFFTVRDGLISRERLLSLLKRLEETVKEGEWRKRYGSPTEVRVIEIGPADFKQPVP